MQEMRTKQLEVIKDKMRQISELSSERDSLDLANTRLQQKNISLENQTQQLTLEKDQLNNRLTVSDEQLQLIRQALAALQEQQSTTQEQLTVLQQSYADKKLELEMALNKIALSDQELSDLRGDYDKLKVKYDKLVRPARTPAGKYVVEVRYAKVNKQYQIAYKTPEQGKFTDISQSALDNKLDGLKKSHPKQLYIKVIFPENSGLSYSEAWEFTTRLHKKYDYYFQDEP
jgi:chromosome segregation ATPase